MAELALSDAAGAEPTEAGEHSLPRVRLAGREAEAEEREPAPAEGGEEREAARSERQKRRDENIRAGGYRRSAAAPESSIDRLRD